MISFRTFPTVKTALALSPFPVARINSRASSRRRSALRRARSPACGPAVSFIKRWEGNTWRAITSPGNSWARRIPYFNAAFESSDPSYATNTFIGPPYHRGRHQRFSTSTLKWPFSGSTFSTACPSSFRLRVTLTIGSPSSRRISSRSPVFIFSMASLA